MAVGARRPQTRGGSRTRSRCARHTCPNRTVDRPTPAPATPLIQHAQPTRGMRNAADTSHTTEKQHRAADARNQSSRHTISRLSYSTTRPGGCACVWLRAQYACKCWSVFARMCACMCTCERACVFLRVCQPPPPPFPHHHHHRRKRVLTLSSSTQRRPCSRKARRTVRSRADAGTNKGPSTPTVARRPEHADRSTPTGARRRAQSCTWTPRAALTASCVGASIAVRWRAAAQKKPPQKGHSPVRTVTRCVNGARVEQSSRHSIIDGTGGTAELGGTRGTRGTPDHIEGWSGHSRRRCRASAPLARLPAQHATLSPSVWRSTPGATLSARRYRLSTPQYPSRLGRVRR
jgi:hypothetical protein